MEIQSAEKYLASRPWSEESMVWIGQKISWKLYSAHKKQMKLAPCWPQMEPQGAKNGLASRPWSNTCMYLVWIWRKSVENSGLQNAHKKTPLCSLVATNGIAECPKLIGVWTLVPETCDLNLKKIWWELWGAHKKSMRQRWQHNDESIVSPTFVQGYNDG